MYVKHSKRLISRFVYIFLFIFLTLLAFQNCTGIGQRFNFTSIEDNLIRSNIGGTGDGFDGKPGEGDWSRTYPNYECPQGAKSIQAAIRIEATTGNFLNDNCTSNGRRISITDPGIDFKFYNPDFFVFSGAIFEADFSDKPFHINEALCRIRADNLGIDALVQSDSAGISRARILTGDYTNRTVTTANFDRIQRSQNASSTTFQSSDTNFSLVINGTPTDYKNLSGRLISKNSDGVAKEYTVNCQKMSLAAVLPAANLNPTVYLVDRTSGSDANNGMTDSTAFFSVARCASTVKPGDTCLVKNGTYTESVYSTTSGTATGRITYKNYPGHRPWLRFNKTGIVRFELISRALRTVPISYVTVEGFEMSDSGYDGLKITYATEVIIKNNYFHNNDGDGIMMQGYRNRIEANRFTRNGSLARANPALRLSGQQNTFVNNIIEFSAGAGLQSVASAHDPTGATGFADPLFMDFKDNLIANNTFAYNGLSGFLPWGSGGVVQRNMISNNIFYQNCRSGCSTGSSQGIYYSGTNGFGDIIANNLFYATGNAILAIAAGGSTPATQYTEANNMINTQSPLFVNAPIDLTNAPGDYHLQSLSPAINSGQDLSSRVLLDFDGNARPRNGIFDMGAYEF